MRIISLMLLLFFPLISHAIVLKTEARSTSEKQAKREAMAALADSILVEVKSEVTSIVKGTGERKDEHRISSRSDIPLIGAELSCSSTAHESICEARLDSSKSLLIYTRKIESLRLEISDLDKHIRDTEPSNRYPLLIRLLTLVEQYDKHRAVAQMLGETKFTPPSSTRANTQEQLRLHERLVDNLDIAAQIISTGISVNALYIYPAAPYGSHEVTAFGRVMRDKIEQQLKPVNSPDKASHFLKGEYEQLDNSLVLTYRMLDDSGNTLETRIATLSPAAYQGLQTKPITIDFDRLLHDGVVLGNNFRAQINSNRGSEDILFDEMEEVELFVKINRPGYFYVVGHIVKEEENFSYLLDLFNTEGDRRFIRYVNADDVNKWLSIGRFEATPPFGIESLQLIASNDDPINRLPTHPHDKSTDLHLIAQNALQGIAKTRALRPKRSEADKQYQTEAVLLFTTMPKRINDKEN